MVVFALGKQKRRYNMKRRKKWILIAVALLLIFAIAFWYLFMGSKISDASSEVISGENGTRSLIVYFSRAGELSESADAASSATPNSNQSMDGSDTEAASRSVYRIFAGQFPVKR